MKRKMRSILLSLLLVTTVILAAGCGAEDTPYEVNDADNFNVSVKFDANGGTFTTNTPVIVDSFNLSQVKTDGEGKSQIALIPPESEARGKNKFEAVNNGYFLAGWYQECTVQEGSDGQKTYTYSGKWDFEKDLLAVDPKGSYSAAEPVMTLYAAWVPLFEIEYYALETGELLTSVSYNPTEQEDIVLPVWDEATGALDMKDIPAREGFTYTGLYLDAEGKQAVTAESLAHTGKVDLTTATAENATMKLYASWKEGKWFRIQNAQQLAKNASLDGCYEIMADLDFAEEIWPTVFMYGNFTGKILGNGHTISNVSVEQTDTARTAAGVFGKLAETAVISDLKLSNVEFIIQNGTRSAGTAYGLLAGAISDKAQITNLQIENGVLKIDSNAYFGTDDYVIGLVCGMGTAPIPYDGITCEATGDDPASIVVTVTDGTVTVTPAA